MEINGKEVTKITQTEYKQNLTVKENNMLVFGKSGIGKTAIVKEFAEENGLKLLDYDLAGRLPEEVAGIPAVNGNFYTRTLDKELEDFFAKEGEGYILLFDEINQGSPDTLNTLYRITHPNPAMRVWAGHNISKCQIIACGNMADGTDGTVYLTDLPTPLINRFYVFELVASTKDTTNYLKNKYKNIPQVAKYIRVLIDNEISPRDIDEVLKNLQYEYSSRFIEAKIGSALTAKLLDIQKGVKNLDPAELITNARKVYNKFKEDGEVMFGAETITTEEELRSKFEEFLSDEEVAGIMKGEE